MRVRSTGWVAIAVALTLLVAACGSSKDVSSAPPSTGSSGTAAPSTDELLGAINPASGEPVPVGMISTGKTDAIDNQIELDVAQATVKWWNERKGGIGGRPIELVTCVDGGEPGKAADCANELIQKDVVAVVIGSSAVIANEWEPLHAANIPVVTYSASGALLTDDQSTFALGSPTSGLLSVSVQAAKDKQVDKIDAVVIDVPAATDNYTSSAPDIKAEDGIDIDLLPIPLGTPDMTPQMQQIVSGNPDGVVNVLGNDSFCIAAFNGLEAAGFAGTVTTASPCISDATRKAVSGDFLEGIQLSYTAPVGDETNPSTQLYEAVMKTYGNGNIDLSRVTGASMFITVNALAAGVEGIGADVTPATVIAAMRAMPWIELPGAGGLHFRCNKKAEPKNPAVCLTGVLVSSLDAKGQPTSFTPANDDPIPD